MAAVSPAGGQRFKIGRGTLADFRSLIVKLLAGVTLWLAAFFVLIPTLLPVMKGWFLVLGPGGLLAMVLALIVYLNLPGWLHVGTDGVWIDSRGSRQYVPFADIDDAPPYAEDVMGKRMIGVALALRSGVSIKVPIGEDQFGADKRVAELSAGIRAALETFRRSSTEDDAASLEPRDRSAEAWLARLRSFGEGANAGPREAPIPVDRLWRIVEDPHAIPAVRAGAAVALARGLDAEGKQRLRVVAGSTAAPHLRIALEAAAEDDEDAVSAALNEVHGGGPSPGARSRD